MRGEVRTGRVSSTDAKRHTAKVEFKEIDGLVTFDLNVLITRPGDYSLPADNSLVVCLMLDGNAGVGYVLGAIYSEADAAPTDDKARRVVAGDDVRIGAFDADDFAAKAQKTLDRLNAIVDDFNNHTHDLLYTFVPGTGAADLTFGAGSTATTEKPIAMDAPASVAADQVRVK